MGISSTIIGIIAMVMDLGSISQDGVWNIELVVSTNRCANGIEKKKISRSDWFKSGDKPMHERQVTTPL